MASITRGKAKGMPSEPSWRFHSSTSELKRDILRRIASFFEYEINRKEFASVYTEYKNGILKSKSANVVCDTALDILKMQSVKIAVKTAVQLSKKLMVLQPFNKEMEAPRKEISTPNREVDPVVTKEIVEIHDSDTNSQQGEVLKSVPSSPKSQDTVAELGNNESVGHDKWSMIDIERMLDNKISNLETKIQQDIVDGQAMMRKEMKSTLEECFANSFRLNMEENVMKVIGDTGQSVIDDMMNERKSYIMEKLNETTKEAMQLTVQGFNTTADQKRNMIINDMQSQAGTLIEQMVHVREGALEDVTEEAAQAISDVQTVTEQSRVNIRNEYEKIMSNRNDDTVPVTPNKPDVQLSSRFKNVDVTNLSTHPPPESFYGTNREPRKFRNQSNMQRKNMYDQPTVQNHEPQWQNSHYAVSGFHKHFRAKLQNDNHILNFYQQLFVQGPKYGIHIKNLKEVYPNNDLCPPSYSQAARDDMARTIYQKMQDEDCVSIGYSKAQRIIEQYAHISDGFKVLEQLLRFVHPNLQQVTANTYEVPKLSQCKGDIYEYGALIMNYILRQEISLRKYTLQEQSIMFLNNMDEKRYFDAKNRALAEIRQTSSNDGTFDPNLNIESLPTTISQYQMQIDGSDFDEKKRSRYDSGRGFIRSILTKNEDNDEMEREVEDDVDVPWIRAMGMRREFPKRDYHKRDYPKKRFYKKDNTYNNYDSMKQCTACGRWGCQETKCQFVAKVQLALNYIRNNSSKTVKLAEEYLRTNSRRTKMSTIRTLTSFASNGQYEEVESMRDEDLLQHFDVDIPMEEIDSSGNNE